jgi:hypothetical protein
MWRGRRAGGLTLRVFIVVEMDYFVGNTAYSWVLRDLLGDS